MALMRQIRSSSWVILAAASVVSIGCQPEAAPTVRSTTTAGATDIYVKSVSDTLNNLPAALDLNLLPAQPILTASTSSDGKEVRALLIRNPANPEGPINYLQAVDGNANFATLDVKAGDIVRYYVNLDADALERNLEERTALQLRVRRRDATDPENVLLLEVGTDAPVLEPQRIEVWRYSDKRADAIRSMLATYVNNHRPPAGWEPSPDLAALQQIVERANQWLRNLPPTDEKWTPTPLIATWPEELRQAPGARTVITEDNLAGKIFGSWEGRLLEQAAWCRDVSLWVRRDASSDLDAAMALFDWTVRNIQLDPPRAKSAASAMVHHPWQAMIYGHGTAEHRAWTFIELCRQQGIDAMAIQPAAPEGEDDPPAPLLVGAVVDDEVYLFDPALGLPLPGREKVGMLAELAVDDALLRQFDHDKAGPYPLTAAQLDGATALIAATPLQLSWRTARLEQELEGENFIKLSVDADALAARFEKLPHIAAVKLWEVPYRAVVDEFAVLYAPTDDTADRCKAAAAEFRPFAEQPLLWKARVLHFQGNKGRRAAERGNPLADERVGHQDALALYQNGNVRKADAKIAAEEPDKQTVDRGMKSAAGYWLGLLSYDRENYDVARSWLDELTLKREPTGKWSPGARYNLARTYEMLGQFEDAIKLLESDPADAPQRRGNLLRARQLAQRAAEGGGDKGDSEADAAAADEEGNP
jgi:tetratricopeptide (TPR) repeat protein